MAKIDPRLVELLKKYGEDNSAVWNCHGTWVAYHAAVERMAAKASIQFDGPQMIVNDHEKKTVVIIVSARMGERSEWSFGEVAPSNNKNAYPYAMAEKRAKDRVALKLLGMAGLVYSEEEADDFKASAPRDAIPKTDALQPANDKPKSSAQLKRDKTFEHVRDELAKDMQDVHTFAQFEQVKEHYRAEAKANGWNQSFLFGLSELFGGYEVELQKRIEAENAMTDAEAIRHPLNA